ncbi:hypothetical protein ACN28S_43410 [Cystobacter fuscus]
MSRGSRAPVPVRPPSRGEVEPGASALLPLEGLALVALVWGRDRAAELFEGLKDSDAVRARGYRRGSPRSRPRGDRPGWRWSSVCGRMRRRGCAG